MKKFFVIAASLMLAAAPAANAQALLNKLKEKATNAINNAVSEKVSEKINDKASGKIAEKTGIDMKSMEEDSSSEFPISDSREVLQPKRSSSFGWDGVVTPSSAQFPIPLMGEFPAVPSASKLANPVEEDEIAYYKAIKAVTLRAEELNADTTCEDEFTEKWRAEAEKELMDAFGITADEMKAMNDGTLTPAQQEALEDRMRAKILGGVDLAQLESQAKKAEGMNENDFMEMAASASAAVFRKHDAELRKYHGISADEYIAATRESMKSNNEAATRALEKKAEAHIKTLDTATQKDAKAFQSTLQKELMQASMNAVPGAGSALQVAQNMASLEKSFSPMIEKMQKMRKYNDDIIAAWPKQTWSDADARFSDSDRKKIEAIKAQIYATAEADKYNPLYLQALELIRTYRERAAKVWAADVQKRYDGVKNSMGDVIKIQRQAVEDGVIPECALWRTPLNLVIIAGDILAEAYNSFPCNYPVMYSEEVVREVKLQEGEVAWWPEFYVAESLDEVLAGKNIFKEKDGKVYQFNQGQWSQVPEDYGKNMVKSTKRPAGASFKSSDGKREVLFNTEGGFLQLPEGDIVYPAVWDKRGDELIWAVNETVYDKNGAATTYRIVKCTYKL
ncbi:MAG: hypothetical protein MJY88_06935 [Bacteroidales bacterium]|nr:hypothetical protein [Bacteroidales bacterium]